MPTCCLLSVSLQVDGRLLLLVQAERYTSPLKPIAVYEHTNETSQLHLIMADFMKSLWESIFTPGPTPPLLLATNASFGALQAVLFALLLATRSVHFVVLSMLCAALWWAINWFVAELKATEEQNRAREKDGRGETPRPADTKQPGGPGQAASERDDDAEDEDTETEGDESASRASLLDASPNQHRTSDAAMDSSGHLLPRPSSSAASDASGVQVHSSSGDDSDLRKRGSELEMSSATDSEWEKVSDAGAQESGS